MTVPDFQSWFLPLLRSVADGEVHKLSELYGHLASKLGLSETDRQELLPSGKQLKFRNRIGWARTYLTKAKLLTMPKSGYLQITERGQHVLVSPPQKVNVKFLKQFSEFRDFHGGKSAGGTASASQASDEVASTPEEQLEQAHEELRAGVMEEVLGQVKAAPPEFFESLVVELLLRMGYGGSRRDAGKTIGLSGDGGIDGIIKEDRLGLDVVCIQAKRWEGTVHRPGLRGLS